MTSELENAESFYYRAQAQAHLGQYNQALKTLQLAEQQFSATRGLAYAAANVHTLAGNQSAAIVEVENAIAKGMGTIWFHLQWFHSLCGYPLFTELVYSSSQMAELNTGCKTQ